MPSSSVSHRSTLPLALVLLAAWICYLPGLSGSFLFDDLIALPVLGAGGPIDNVGAFLRYITSGTSDPTGRPLALLTFLFDARDWPADPAPFLRTNILLHLVNGALLYRLLARLETWNDTGTARGRFVPLLATGLWVLHPFFVSTVLYVIQREAVLCATFVLAGLLAYVRGRRQLALGQPGGLCWMTLGIVGGTLPAVLCKANGALLPLLAATLEATVLRAPKESDAPAIPRRALLLLALPLAVLAAYVATIVPGLAQDNDRAWTISQRLLTQPRVLIDYLRLLFVPRVLSSGLYNDAYPVSTGLGNPPGTWLAMVAIIGLASAAWLYRRRATVPAAAILFFLAGHLLESTVLPLEMYFEHRNYLPAMLLFWPMARAVGRWKMAWSRWAAIVLLALWSVLLWQRTSWWGQPRQMALVWAHMHPDSSRAQATAASVELASGNAQLAIARLAPLWRARPDDLQLAINYADAACAMGGLLPGDAGRMAHALRNTPEGRGLVHAWLQERIGDSQCQGIDQDVLSMWLASAMDNPKLMRTPAGQQDLLSLRGELALRSGQASEALHDFDLALALAPRPETAAYQTALLGSHGYPALGLAHLDHYARLRANKPVHGELNMAVLHRRVLDAQGYWPREFSALRVQLERDAIQLRNPTP